MAHFHPTAKRRGLSRSQDRKSCFFYRSCRKNTKSCKKYVCGIIYLAKNKLNKKKYIGKTTQLLEIRKQNHFKKSLKKTHCIFHLAIKKYGMNSFTWRILAKAQNLFELNAL